MKPLKFVFLILSISLLAACASTLASGTSLPLTTLPAQTSSPVPSRIAQSEETQPLYKAPTFTPSPALPSSLEAKTPKPFKDMGALFPPQAEIVFTIRNEQPYRGRAGDPKPDWLAWGAQAFAVAPDDSFWIADSAAEPPRLLHYSPTGELLRTVSLEGLLIGLADVEVDKAHLWALGIASMPPKVIQFSPNGTYQASFDLPEGLRPENGLTGIALAEDGALLAELEGSGRLYQLIKPSGEVDLQPLAGLHPGKWIAPDGSYYSYTFEMEPGPVVQGKRLVRRYGPTDKLLGELELPEAAVYTQHDLALGLDGDLYFMISRPNHSVEIWRLGFGGDSFPGAEATPTPRPTLLTPLLPAWETPPPDATDLEIARQALLRFFTYLDEERYAEAAELFGGSYADLPVVRDDLLPTSEDKALVWESECQLLQCHLLVSNLVEAKQVSPDEYVFVVEFVSEFGTLFMRGPCCGASEAEMPPVWQFPYTVKNVGGQFKVMEPPVYGP